MNLRCLLPLLCLAMFPVWAQQPTAPAPVPPDVRQKLQEAYELQQTQKYADAMQKLDEVEALVPELPELYNMRGSLYLTPALRDFDKAQELLDKAESMNPNSLAPKFNKAELLFVKQDWTGAEKAFQNLLANFPKLPAAVRHLTLYKLLICEVKLGKVVQAEQRLKENFTFMDDSPAYYFGNAAIAFGKKDEAAAKDWLARAAAIYKPEEQSAYMDSLMEARWVPNINLPTTEPN